jgi:hypothetical protein
LRASQHAFSLLRRTLPYAPRSGLSAGYRKIEVSFIGVTLSLLLVPVIFLRVGDRDPGRGTVLVIGGILATAAVVGPLVALASEIRPL